MFGIKDLRSDRQIALPLVDRIDDQHQRRAVVAGMRRETLAANDDLSPFEDSEDEPRLILGAAVQG